MQTHAALRLKMKEGWSRLRGGGLTPWRAALSVGIGLAVGVTPLYGLHLPIVVAVCLPLRLDAPVAYLAANISIPLVAPFLWLSEIEIGAFLRTGHGLALTVATLRAQGVGGFIAEVVVGTFVLAPVMAAVGGAFAFVVTSRAQRRSTESARDASENAITDAIDRVALRYGKTRRATRYYVRGKLAGDPVVRRVAELGKGGALGRVCDAGCGRGQLALVLLEAGCAASVWGFDWDAAKVAEATRASNGLDARFEVGDLRTQSIAGCDSVLLIDVLHYMTDAEQDATLERAARSTRKFVFVRELDPDRGLRSTLTKVQERITTGLGYNKGARVRPRRIAELSSVLEREGFVVRVQPCWGGTPFSNVLIVATRGAAA